MDTEAAQRHLIELDEEIDQLQQQQGQITQMIKTLRNQRVELYIQLHQEYRLKANV